MQTTTSASLKKLLAEHLRDAEPWLEALLFCVRAEEILVYLPHCYYFSWFAARYRAALEQALAGAAPAKKIRYVLAGQDSAAASNSAVQVSSAACVSPLPEFPVSDAAFANFFDTGKNFLALKAARQAARGALNPPFILGLCGKSGLGKTHLLTAIYRSLREDGLKATFSPALQFCQAAPGWHQLQRARQFWREKIVILDDMQALAGEKALQEFLIAGIDCLGMQLIFAFSGAPSELGRLEKRLRLRLASGLIFELSAPDMETRLRYVEQACKDQGIGLRREQQLFLARETALVPTLKGVMRKIKFFASIYGRAPETGEIESLILPAGDGERWTWKEIASRVAARLDIKPQEMLSTQRKPALVLGRQLVMYICRFQLGMAYQEIGRIFGGLDHSTVMHGIKKIGMLKDTDKKLRNLVTELEDEVAYSSCKGDSPKSSLS